MKDYSKGKIYFIESNQSDKIYIGSTTSPTLAIRMSKHRNDYKRYLEGLTRYVTSFELLKFDDARIYLIEKYPCKDIDELNAREGYWQREFWTQCHNKNLAGRGRKQYYEDNKVIIAEKNKKYREENKDAIKEMKSQDYIKNKEKRLNAAKEYYQKNRQKKLDYASKRINCDICDKEMNRTSIYKHKKTMH